MSRVTILMGTRNGARYLPDQLCSIAGQRHRDWQLWVSDDGSDDDTWAILQRFQRSLGAGRVRLLQGPRRGVMANYMALLRHPDLRIGPVMLSDQDDVWFPDRIDRALAHIGTDGPPAVYAGATLMTDAALRPLRRPVRRLHAPCFPHVLVQNVMAGNTMGLNAAALRQVRADAPLPPDVPFHDWWLCLRFAAAGARMLQDPVPCLYYRQHGANLFAGRRGLRPMLRRARWLLDGTFRSWIDAHCRALLRLDGLPAAHRDLAAALLRPAARSALLGDGAVARIDGHGRWVLPVLARAGLV